MSRYPPPPPPYYGPPPPWPHHHPPPPPGHYPPPPPGHYPPPPPGLYPHPDHMHPAYYVPMIPVPVPPQAEPTPNPTYITNYIYHGENSNTSTPAIEPAQVAENSGEFDWVPTTTLAASHLTGRAVAGGHEGWDGSPLWVVRAWHNGDLIPGKFSVRHNTACVAYDGKEIPVQNIEVLCAAPQSLRWVPASNGLIPPGAIAGGQTASGETLYVGRARHQLSVSPGKIHPTHNSCYIAFSGTEVAHKMYDVLCRIS